jgi:hypothetical protein
MSPLSVDVVDAEAAYNACKRKYNALQTTHAETVREYNKLVILLAFLLAKHYPRREVTVSAMEWHMASGMGEAGIAVAEGLNKMTGELSFQVIHVPADQATR